MKRSTPFSVMMTLLGLSFAAQVFAQEMTVDENGPFETNALTEQSFEAPTTWARELSMQQGWGAEHPRFLLDMNADNRKDVVGFGNDGVWIATSTGSAFRPSFVLADFGYNQAWRVQKHTRALGDLNGDKRPDVVGFGDAGVYTSLSTGGGFSPVSFVIADFGYNQGWRVDRHVRLLADVSGDGKDDIIAFGNDGVWLALSNGAGGFNPPTFVIQDLGFNQGWTNSKHFRTMADINGDGRQDIVAFGDRGVTIARSTGAGFEPPRLALRGFGLLAGSWRVDRHPRMLADLNNDGRQDIIGFGDAGVWTALSNGNGFAAMRFVVANFGYNQGWRVANHPRFVADLNNDGYKDIVGYGQKSIYRSLGSPTGFDPMRGVLRDLVAERSPFNLSNASQLAPRFVGDVNADGMSDLVAIDQMDIKVARSSNQPPPAPPRAPSNLRVTGASESSVSVAWNDNSDNERRFLIYYAKSGQSAKTTSVAANVTTLTIGSLEPDTNYCFSAQAESLFDLSPETAKVCKRTDKKIVQTTISMVRQQILEGPVPYVGTFGPIFEGARIIKINFPSTYPTLLVKPGHSTEECNNGNAIVPVQGDMTAAQMTTVFGTSNISITGQQRLNFVGCTSNPNLPDLIFVNITWEEL